VLTDPFTYVLGLGSAGAALVVAGVAVLFGTGPALIASGVALFAAAALIARGMKSHA
jgi:hypothetical protein